MSGIGFSQRTGAQKVRCEEVRGNKAAVSNSRYDPERVFDFAEYVLPSQNHEPKALDKRATEEVLGGSKLS